MVHEGEAELSAKWRRTKRNSKGFRIFRSFSRGKDKIAPQTFSARKTMVKRLPHPHTYRIPKIYGERNAREPEPLIDILEEETEIIVVAEFVGFKRENLRANVKNQRLTLSADTLDRKYYKSLNLPKRVIPNTIRMTHKNGVLEIRLKKAVEEKTIGKVAG
jgi:HSP20 family molecular chaperone IbpA